MSDLQAEKIGSSCIQFLDCDLPHFEVPPTPLSHLTPFQSYRHLKSFLRKLTFGHPELRHFMLASDKSLGPLHASKVFTELYQLNVNLRHQKVTGAF